MKKVFIDTDVGYDDILAITALLLSKRVSIVGISTVEGVSKINSGIKNLSSILKYSSIDLAIIKGKSLPRNRKVNFPNLDRDRANSLILLSSLQLPKTINLVKTSNLVEDFIFKMTSPTKTTILALGPLINIASVIQKYKDKFCKNIDQIIFMGGGIFKGNVPPDYQAEYNILLDPKSASVVFNSGIPIKMVGVDAAYFTSASIAKTKIKKINSASPLVTIFKMIIQNNNGDFDYLYDLLAAAILLRPSLNTKSVNLSIDIPLEGPEKGKTLVRQNQPINTEVVLEINSGDFFDYLEKSLNRGTF